MNPLYDNNGEKRIVASQESNNRSPYRRDNGRLIHSAVFRRLQGKTQLFPNYESDFFRNRLTHSIEVAQIAKGIAEDLNFSNDYFKKNPIDTDLVETAALAHDLGHPPFGHNGEKALDDMMKCYGGFEGNAQTLRILSRLEKKNTLKPDYAPISDDNDQRCGLNLCFRTLAATLKYDKEIPMHRDKGTPPLKGYYYTEAEVVTKIKEHLLGKGQEEKLKSIECQIMDIADDIAYSTYDLEDAFKAEFLCPLGMLAVDPIFIEKIAKKVSKNMDDNSIGSTEVYRVLYEVFELFDSTELNDLLEMIEKQRADKELKAKDILPAIHYASSYAFDLSKRICSNGYLRTRLTSALVGKFMSGVEVEVNSDCPILSKVRLTPETRKSVEILKTFTFHSVIESPRVKIAEFRGYDIVQEIFTDLVNNDRKGYNLLPEDFRMLYDSFKDKALKMRVVSDFIAGMTDRYAVEFYARLKSENPQTIFKPF